MSTIDASIPLGVKPFQMESPVNQLAKLMQVKQLQQEGELGQMKMDEYRRGIEDQNALRSALSAPGADPYNVLLQRGKVKEAIDFQKGNAEVGKITAETKKYGADTEKSQLETARGRVALIGQLAGAVKDQSSLDRALMIARTHGIDTSNIPPVYDPATIQQVRNSALTVEQQLEQVWKQKGYDLDVAKAGETVRHNKSTEGLTARGQNMVDARSRENNDIQRQAARTQVINDPIQGPILVDKGTGGARNVTLNGARMPGEVASKQTAAANKTLAVLDDADKLIDQATGSYFGAGVDATGRLVGKVPAGADAIAKLKVLEGQIMMSQPRMEGPQSDKDTMLYRQMAGQIGDPTIPASQKKAALASIREIQTRYAGGAAPAKPAGGTQRISSDAEYNALPSGAVFIGPDGKQRRKP